MLSDRGNDSVISHFNSFCFSVYCNDQISWNALRSKSNRVILVLSLLYIFSRKPLSNLKIPCILNLIRIDYIYKKTLIHVLCQWRCNRFFFAMNMENDIRGFFFEILCYPFTFMFDSVTKFYLIFSIPQCHKWSWTTFFSSLNLPCLLKPNLTGLFFVLKEIFIKEYFLFLAS